MIYHDGCGSPWYILNHDRKVLTALIKRVKGRRRVLLGWHKKKCTGWCFENAVRVVISSSKYTGFKQSIMSDREEDSDSSVTDL